MQKDILFKTDDFMFSYRVGGILIQNGKILLQKPANDDYSIIGGHVSAMETTAETLRREFMEEIHADIRAGELLAVGEIFFPWGSKPCHQISMYYCVQLTDPNAIPADGSFWGYDDFDNQRVNLKYCWVPIEELRNIKVYPEELIPHILSGEKQVFHFISNQL